MTFFSCLQILQKSNENFVKISALASKDLFIKNRTKHTSKTLLSWVRFFMNKSLKRGQIKKLA